MGSEKYKREHKNKKQNSKITHLHTREVRSKHYRAQETIIHGCKTDRQGGNTAPTCSAAEHLHPERDFAVPRLRPEPDVVRLEGVQFVSDNWTWITVSGEGLKRKLRSCWGQFFICPCEAQRKLNQLLSSFSPGLRALCPGRIGATSSRRPYIPTAFAALAPSQFPARFASEGQRHPVTIFTCAYCFQDLPSELCSNLYEVTQLLEPSAPWVPTPVTFWSEPNFTYKRRRPIFGNKNATEL